MLMLLYTFVDEVWDSFSELADLPYTWFKASSLSAYKFIDKVWHEGTGLVYEGKESVV